MTSSQLTKLGNLCGLLMRLIFFVCHPLYPPHWWLTGSCLTPVLSPAPLLFSPHFLSSPPRLPLTSFLLSFDLLTPLIYPLFFRPPALSSHLPSPFSTHLILLSFLLSSTPFPLLLYPPSLLLWRLNLSLSSECLWAEVGYCWCCSHHNFWGADNSPAILPVFICACFHMKKVINSYTVRADTVQICYIKVEKKWAEIHLVHWQSKNREHVVDLVWISPMC